LTPRKRLYPAGEQSGSALSKTTPTVPDAMGAVRRTGSYTGGRAQCKSFFL
jgi:hypothetical protein